MAIYRRVEIEVDRLATKFERISAGLFWERFQPFVVITATIIVWEAVGRMAIYPPYILPKFSTVVVTLYDRLLSQELIIAALMSIERVGSGFLLGILLGLPLGLLIGWSKTIHGLVNPIIESLRPIPPIAWIPLSVIWLGIGLKSVVFITFLGAFFPIVVNTIHGVKSVDKKVIEYSQALGASTRQILLKVVIPSSLPVAFVGIRIGLGFTWMTVVAAEMISVKYGLGYMIWKARYAFETEAVIGGMICIGLLSIIMTKGMLQLEDRLFRWRKGIVKG